MPDFSKWAKQLKHPLVLVGLGLLLLNKFTSRYYSEQLKWIFVVVCCVVILVGLLLAARDKGGAGTGGDNVTQQSKGRQSPNVVSKGDVNITYNDTDSSKGGKGK